MNINHIFKAVIESDPRTQWTRFTHKDAERAVFNDDVNLRIESHFDDDLHNSDFKEAWANNFPDPRASSRFYNIYYGASLIAYRILVSVDGGRATLPLPDKGTMEPDPLGFRIAEIFDTNTLHDYVKRAGIKHPPRV
jgi:hypothetical protein